MHRVRWVSVVIVLALVAVACGRDNGTTTSGSTTTAGGQGPASTAAPSTGLAAGDFGDLQKVCGPKPAGAQLKATDTGVKADSIQVSTFSDPGFSGRPGLNQELFDSATAFVNWCNEKGGINGRAIDLKLRDAKLSEFQQRVIEACDQGDFMMVGGGNVFDNTGQKDRLACGLPDVAGYAVSAEAGGADLLVQPVPNPASSLPIGDLIWLAEKYPASKNAFGVLTGNLPTLVTQAKRFEEALKSVGWNEVYSEQFNVTTGEPTWRPFAEKMKARGVKGLVFVGEPVEFASLMKALQEIGYKPDWVSGDANEYDDLLVKEGGTAADGAEIRSVFYPFLDRAQAKKYPATQQYLDLIAKYKPGGKVAYLGVQGFSAWLLFAVSARDCGADLTRDCVFAKTRSYRTWTGGGLHAPADTKGKQPTCFALYGVHNGRFVLEPIKPNRGIFKCETKNVVTLHGDYGTGVKCPNPAFATDPKPSNCAK